MKKIFLLLVTSMFLFACNKNPNTSSSEPTLSGNNQDSKDHYKIVYIKDDDSGKRFQDYLITLEAEVDKLMLEGWKPTGGVVVTYSNMQWTGFIQTLVR